MTIWAVDIFDLDQHFYWLYETEAEARAALGVFKIYLPENKWPRVFRHELGGKLLGDYSE